MTVRPIRLVGDPVLRTACEPVTRFDDGLARLVTDLMDTVRLPGRAGLAANQIGVGLAVFAYNVDDRLGYVINPVLAEPLLAGTVLASTVPADMGDEQEGPEACLSIPGISAVRRRAARATVTGIDLDGEPVRVGGGGELARCLQHEADHLRGELYIDGLAADERALAMRRLREQIARRV
jgi:peptide deformylase